MIEDYGTLSEEELLEEILQELEDSTEIDKDLLEFKFSDGKLHLYGTLQNQEELESLVSVLENHIEPEDYELEVDLVEEQSDRGALNRGRSFESEEEDEADEGKLLEESLEELGDEEEVDFIDEEGIDDQDKW